MIDRSKLLILGLISILLIGSMLHYSVSAQEDEEETESETEIESGDSERSISIERSDSSVSIESASEQESQEDSLEIEIDISGNPEFRLEYYSESTSTETEAEIRVELYELIEFEDINDNGVYDGSDTDTLVQTYDLGEVGYDPISYTKNPLDSGVTEHVISFQTSDGVFKSVIHIVGQFANIEGTDLQPTSLKIDYIISNFNFDQENSKLALFSEVETSTEIETESETDAGGQIESDEEAVVQGSDGAFAFYSWQKTAQVDGSTTDVLASYNEISGSYQELYLNYEQGQEIIHDPKLGVSLSGVDSTDGLALNYTPIIIVFLSISLIAIGNRVRLNKI